jgi:iron(III) transport system substrate-binding protein
MPDSFSASNQEPSETVTPMQSNPSRRIFMSTVRIRKWRPNPRLLICLVAGFCVVFSPAAFSQSGKLTIYSAYENSQIKPLVAAFEKANPEVKVEHFHQPGEELLATLELELRARSPKADIIGLNDASLNYLQKKHGALLPYAAKDIEKVRPEVQDRTRTITPAFVNLYLIHYNVKKITAADAPRSWADLDAPRWKDAISMADPSSSQSVQSFIWFVTEYLGKKEPDKYGWNYFKRLGANGLRLESSHGTIRDMTVSGERPLGIQLLANAQTAANRGEPTNAIWPREGSPGELSAFALLKDAQNKDSGRKWLDFIVSTNGQALMPDSLGGAPIRNDVSYKYPDGTPVDQVKIVPVDSAFIAENRKAQARKFHEAIGK